MTLFHLDPLSRTPIYEQLKRQIMTYISVGLLKENDQLPSVRQFAQDLGINPNTVHRVYRELEQTGVLYTVPQKGTFVSGIPMPPRKIMRNGPRPATTFVSGPLLGTSISSAAKRFLTNS